MNYFAHGYRWLDRPWLLAGTAVPDWLGTADRSWRLRRARVEPFANGDGSARSEVAAGIVQHLDDDRWFHEAEAFRRTSARLADGFREVAPTEEGHRPGFLGHLATEMLLDAVLIERDPSRLDRYYEALTSVDPLAVQASVNEFAAGPGTERLAPFIGRFLETRFLRDYADLGTLRVRLGQVLSRVGLPPLPASAEAVLARGRTQVRARRRWLAPPPRAAPAC